MIFFLPDGEEVRSAVMLPYAWTSNAMAFNTIYISRTKSFSKYWYLALARSAINSIGQTVEIR